MPYKSIDEVPASLKGIEPPVTLEQANVIAGWADKIEDVESPWAVAIAQFKKVYEVEDGEWVKKVAETAVPDEEDEVEEARYGACWKIDIDGESVTINELVGAWRRLRAVGELMEMSVKMGEPEPVAFTEHAAVVSMTEPDEVVLSEFDGQDKPTHLRVKAKLIRPGWGNKRDNNYYPPEVLRRDAKVWEGSKMYETDHDRAAKNTRNWVSTVERISGFDGDGAPLAVVAVHDPNFAERVRNLAGLGLLEKLECSITGSGRARPDFESGGRRGKYVEAIVEGGDVDWVTAAGAGGHAQALMERSADNGTAADSEGVGDMLDKDREGVPSGADGNVVQSAEADTVTLGESQHEEADEEAGKPDEAPPDLEKQIRAVVVSVLKDMGITGKPAPKPAPPPFPPKKEEAEEADAEPEGLAADAVAKLLAASKLPEPSQERLAGSTYHSEAELQEAVESERTYLQKVTGAGKPVAMGEGARAEQGGKSQDELFQEAEERKRAVNRKYGFGIAGPQQ